MIPNRILLALRAKRLIEAAKPFKVPAIPPHACGWSACIQPLVFGALANAFVDDGILSATVFADYEVHRKELLRVWLHFGYFGMPPLDITRYVLPQRAA